jgi:hypothetical protein
MTKFEFKHLQIIAVAPNTRINHAIKLERVLLGIQHCTQACAAFEKQVKITLSR